MPKPVQKNARYMPGLDGLRAIAVLAVIAYHLHFNWAPGGLLGVGVFFVLSGYLITDLLVAQWVQNGRLDMKGFWLRRARRLLPGLFLMLIVVAAWVTLFKPNQLWTLRGDVLAAVLYVSNWWLIFHHVSYFQSFGPPSPLGHLWSLAVEEQFYLIWPLIVGFLLRHTKNRGWLVGVSAGGTVLSALAMAILYQPGTDPSRVYYGTDTRAFALLIGATLAFFWPSQKLSAHISRPRRWFMDVFAALALFSILYMMWKTNEYQPFLYRGGLVLLSVLTVLVLVALAHPASYLGKALGWQPLRWLGVRSYGIYLWHYPVIVLTSSTVNTQGVNLSRAILQVAASIILADLSWRLVENPIRSGVLKSSWRNLRSGSGRPSLLPRRGWVVMISVLLPLTISSIGLAMPAATPVISSPTVTSVAPSDNSAANPLLAPPNTKPSSTNKPSAEPNPSSSQAPASSVETVKPASSATSLAANQSKSSNTTGPDPSLPNVSHMDKSNPNRLGTSGNGSSNQTGVAGDAGGVTAKTSSGVGMTAIGDSVMIDITPDLEKLFPGIVIDAQVGRQMLQAPAVIQQLKSEGNLGHRVVIIALGTNGPFTKSQLVALLNSLSPVQQIVLVNTREPRPWQSVVNSTLAEVAATYPHTTLVNWYTSSAGKNWLFYPDGVHLNPQGAQYYANLLAAAIDSTQGS